MNLRPLLIDDIAKRKAREVVEYAKLHPYDPVGRGSIPGDNPYHTYQINDYFCVFTLTRSENKLWRHLTISLPGRAFPHPFAVWTIATDLFGFTGWDGKSFQSPKGWLAGKHDTEHCVMVIQEYEPIGWP